MRIGLLPLAPYSRGEGRVRGSSVRCKRGREYAQTPHPIPLPEYGARGKELAHRRPHAVIEQHAPLDLVQRDGEGVARVAWWAVDVLPQIDERGGVPAVGRELEDALVRRRGLGHVLR